jgi:hypothetical protein
MAAQSEGKACVAPEKSGRGDRIARAGGFLIQINSRELDWVYANSSLQEG